MPADDGALLWKLNQRLLTRVLNAAEPQFEQHGIETKEFFVLDEIDESPYPAELAAKLMLPKASVTMYLRNLVEKGLVQREIDQDDLRRHRLTTTAKGRAVRARALDTLAVEFAAMMGKIDGGDRIELRRILLALLN
ncbi:MarR family winged helix-turn-helix transcriptional regulator [Rhodococcoides yunnanense]|uniref:MarR family transcriptional regulator n=1 Tax=Rhodococcoides yunnanense TaxID=278209 RepID=A0ABU4BIR6_9NOCA|nr:MarR family transcriptional regulator [Rhodococcus yunnanensis]MDV6263964.1 MarR family transcriptional regulator [Rhodococcus yunnanensis]